MAHSDRQLVKKYHLPAREREYLTTNLALLLKAAVPIGEAFDSLSSTSKSRVFRAAMAHMKQDIDDGMPLWRALERSGVMPAQTLVLIRLGEESGNLTTNLDVAARQEAKQRTLKSKVRSALIYPIFVLGLTGTIGLGVAWFLLPRLSQTFSQLNVKLPLISRVFLDIGTFLKERGLYAVPLGLIALIFLLYILFAAPKTKAIGNWLLFHLPGISRLMYEVEVSRFGYLLGTLLNAGLSVTESLELLEQSTTARHYQRFYHYLRNAFDEGYGFRAALPKYKAAARLLPPAVQQLLIAGERSGALAETLRTVGNSYEEKADISTQNLEVILEPILLVIVWLGVLGVAIAVILPIYKLTSGLSS
ncbi:MAG TPA: type II secretion system F family protein [Candidatus Saccharimonadales bacterium]|jgi:type IV pilus assembly protein PilC|nr:type II secretion system F family protein [Candidatus Saccharimonadales bacterium]